MIPIQIAVVVWAIVGLLCFCLGYCVRVIAEIRKERSKAVAIETSRQSLTNNIPITFKN